MVLTGLTKQEYNRLSASVKTVLHNRVAVRLELLDSTAGHGELISIQNDNMLSLSSRLLRDMRLYGFHSTQAQSVFEMPSLCLPCSKNCQVTAWKVHKTKCLKMRTKSLKNLWEPLSYIAAQIQRRDYLKECQDPVAA